MSRTLLANLGAEEGGEWRRHAAAPAVASVAALWRDLFRKGEAAFEWLPGPEVAVAWLNTEEALDEARRAGLSLAGPSPAVVREVHDKAWALAAAREEGLVPEALEGLVRDFPPDALLDAEGAAREIEAAVSSWPDWTRGRFTLKPRFGSSGRGRIGGEAARPDPAALVGALPRLRERGGALLEPWLERLEDLSAQLVIHEDGSLLLLGTLSLDTAPSGVYRGHRGTLDRKGRVTSGSDFDEALREAACALALRAAERGLRGPLGVDGFVFRGPAGAPTLRPVVELNARYTVGTVVIGHARRHRKDVTGPLGLDSGERARFVFAPLAPAGGWPEAKPPDSVRIALDEEGAAALYALRSGDLPELGGAA